MKLLLIVGCLLATGWGQTCPRAAWCKVEDKMAHPGSMPKDNGWNNLFFSPDTHRAYIYADDAGAPPTWENAFWSYQVQKGPQTANVWRKVSSCGDTIKTSVRQEKLHLRRAIGTTDTVLELEVATGQGKLERPDFPQPGTIWVGDEAMGFTSCSCPGHPDSCPAGCTSPLTISGLTRGVRQGAGWLAAMPHAAHELANLACPGPFVAGHADHPVSHHPVGCATYDSKRGRIWEAWGYQEMWQLQDTWYLCVTEKPECTEQQIQAGWQRLPLFTRGGANPPKIMENSMVYDPDHDVIVAFGGTAAGNAINDTYVFCLTAGSEGAYGCSDAKDVNKWVRLNKFHGGWPAESEANRMTYDTTNHRVLIYGGNNRHGLLYLVQQYDAGTGDWCMSDARLGGSDSKARWCEEMPKVSYPPAGHPPGSRFPAWTFDTKRGQAAFYAGPGAFYQYDARTNRWRLTGVAGGPLLPALRGGQSMTYADDPDDTYVWKSGNELWQLPGRALSGAGQDAQ